MKNLLALSALLFSAFSFSGEWSPSTTINQLVVGYEGDYILFSTEAPTHNPKGSCGTNYYVVSKDHAAVDHILSVLLVSQTTGTEITIGVDELLCAPLGNYVLVRKVSISK